MKTEFEGKVSWFGGPDDKGVGPDEGLALIEPKDLDDWWFRYLFLKEQPPGTTGLARRLDPEAYYVACRWDRGQNVKDLLRRSFAVVQCLRTGITVVCRPADWGPHPDTGKEVDVSKGALKKMKALTGDLVRVKVFVV